MVFGEGPADARMMFVGEQPGDQEDLAGRPSIGPAGQLFDRAVAEAGFDRRGVYVTNSVKHFKFVPRGKRRIHEKPGTGEINACRFRRWAKKGVWDRLLQHSQPVAGPDVLHIDSTAIKCHRTATGARGSGEEAIGRSRGRLITKVHHAVDSWASSAACSPRQASTPTAAMPRR